MRINRVVPPTSVIQSTMEELTGICYRTNVCVGPVPGPSARGAAGQVPQEHPGSTPTAPTAADAGDCISDMSLWEDGDCSHPPGTNVNDHCRAAVRHRVPRERAAGRAYR